MKVISAGCSEFHRCVECSASDCGFGDILRGVASGKEIESYLRCLDEEKKRKILRRARVCTDQGFCALYCAVECPVKNSLSGASEPDQLAKGRRGDARLE